MRLGHLRLSAWRRDGFGAGGAEILPMHTNTCGGRVEPGQNMCGVESSSLEMFETWQVAGALFVPAVGEAGGLGGPQRPLLTFSYPPGKKRRAS